MLLRRVAGISFVVALVLAGGCGDDDAETGSAPESSAGHEQVEADAVDPHVCEPQVLDRAAPADGPPFPTTRPQVSDEDLPEAIASTFCSPSWEVTYPDGMRTTISPRPVLTQGDAMCIGVGIVDELGAARAQELRFDQSPWSVIGFGIVNNELSSGSPIERPEAEIIAGVFEDCTEKWKLLFMMSLTEGADKISEASAQCASDLIDDDAARSILIGEIDRPDEHAEPWEAHFGPLLDAFDDCLTAAELGGLDFN